MNSKVLSAGIIALFILVMMVLPALGQSPITAEVDRASLSTDETVALTVRINGAAGNPVAPELPPLDGFQVVGSSSGTQIRVVNGVFSSSATYTYHLRPIETGDLVIPPISVTLNGQTYSTDPITIQVTQGSAPAQSAPVQGEPQAAPTELNGQDMYVEAFVDNETPYQGEQITYTFRFYNAVSLGNPANYEPPSFTGFWSDTEPEQVQYNTEAGGRIYNVNEVRTILFPTVAGEIIIEPTRLEVPGGFFSRGANLMTRPVTVDVQPLPPNAPADFTGAVGQYQIDAAVDLTETRVNEPVTWQVRVAGYGNIDTLPEPIWPETPGWRDFDSTSTINTEVRDGRISGSQVYEKLLIPTEAGQLTLPAVNYTYFDPEQEQYLTVSADPITVNVAPGVNGETAMFNPDDTPKVGAEGEVAETAVALKAIKPLAEGKISQPVTQKPIYWLLWLIPVFGVALHYGWQKRQAYRRQNSALIRSQQAQKKANKALKQAQKADSDPYASASQILLTYLMEKLNKPVQGLTQQELVALLSDEGVDTAVAQKAADILTTCEMGRYAPVQDSNLQSNNLLDYTKQVIDELEKEL